MKPTQILIILLVLAGFTTGFITFYGGLMDSYSLEKGNFSTFEATERIYNMTNSSYRTLETIKTDNPTLPDIIVGIPAAFLIAGANAAMLMIQIPNLASGLITDAVVLGGLPMWVGAMVSGILLITMLAAFIYFIIGRPI